MAGNLEFFAIYSYTFQQQSLTQIQLSLVVICALLSIVVGVVIWLVIRGIVRRLNEWQRPRKHWPPAISICALP